MEYLLGVAVSLIVEAIKQYANKNALITYITLLVVSVAGASSYYYFSHTAYWQTILQVLTTAAAFHNLVIRQLDS
jgi:hypothetical protein